MKKFYVKEFIVLALFTFYLFLASLTKAQIITTFAGRAGYLGDGGQATSAIIADPYAMTRDSAGNIYIASAGDGHIRKIDAVTGIISTYGGNTGALYYGDGGPATAAYFNFSKLSGLAVDNNGNLYVGDYGNNRIRKINANTGIVTTVAGNGTAGYSGDNGLAVNAEINGGEGLAVDVAGNVYFSDANNNVIRRIDAGNKKITTVAGILNNTTSSGDGGQATAAAIGVVERIALDAQGNLYLADGKNNVVRRIDAVSHVITTIAGTGTAGYTGDGSQATAANLNGLTGINIDGAGNIYISDRVDGVVRRIAAADGVITTVAGTGVNGYSGDGGAATSAQLDSLTDVVADNLGNLYIDDYINNRIRKVAAVTHIITTIGGNGTSSPQDYVAPTETYFYLTAGIAFDTSGNLYASDLFKVRKINVAFNNIITAAGGGSQTSLGGPATDFNIPYVRAVATDQKSNLYFTDEASNRVIKVDAQTQNVSLVAGNGSTNGSGNGGPATLAGIRPLSLATDAANNIYISDINARVWKVDASSGNIINIAGTGTAGYSGDGTAAASAAINNQGAGIAVDKAGNVYIADRYNYRIRRVDAGTGIITTITGNGTSASTGDNGPAIDAQLTMVRAIALNDSGDIFIADGNRIRKITASTNIITTIAGSDSAGYFGDNGPALLSLLNTPYDLKVNKNGDLYIADLGNYIIRKISGLALPLTFINFSGYLKDKNVFLNWQTASEINTAYFDVQRCSDGANFITIGQVQAAGNSSDNHNYNFTDVNAIKDGQTRLYYRLKELDKDGKNNYSKTVTIKLSTLGFSVKISPNPVVNAINIYPSINAGAASVALLDMNGKVLSQSTHILTAGQPVRIDASKLAGGVYNLIIKTADTVTQLRIIK